MSARKLAICPGIFLPGALNAITDVFGVLVGHASLVQGQSIRTGVTAVHAHSRLEYRLLGKRGSRCALASFIAANFTGQ